jgi:hypothetical protein
MNIAPTPWSAAHDGHGGICLDDAQGRQIGFLSARPEQDAHAALMKAAPLLLAYYRASKSLQMTLGHPDATAQDENDAEAAYAAASNAAAEAVGLLASA